MKPTVTRAAAVALGLLLVSTSAGSAATKTTKKASKTTKKTTKAKAKATATTKARTVTTAAATATTAAGSGGTAAPATTKAAASAPTGPYVIGFTVDLSGGTAVNGVPLLAGAKAKVDAINKVGGVNGRKLELVALDDGGNTARALANITQLIDDKKATVITGVTLSGQCAAAIPLVQQKKVPMICNAAAEDIIKPAQKYVYVGRGITADEARPMADYAANTVLKRTVNAPSISIVTTTSAATASWAAAINNIAKARGWQVLTNDSVPTGTQDVSGVVAKIVKASPDLMLTQLQDPALLLLDRGLRSQGVKIPLVSGSVSSAIETMEAIPSDFWWLRQFPFSVGAADDPGTKQFAADMKAAGKEPNEASLINGYVYLTTVIEALKVCGADCSPDAMAQSLDKTSYDPQGLAYGKVGYSPTDHAALHAFSFWKWDRDTPRFVDGPFAGGVS